jgi:two-component system sensor histidine kinase GlrK
MKITTRIIAGYGLFIVILAALAIYQILTIRRMQSINDALSEVNFKGALSCLKALGDLDLVAEFTRKSFASEDPDYRAQLSEFQRNFEASLAELKAKASLDGERAEAEKLAGLWEAYRADLSLLERSLPAGGPSLPQSLQEDLDRLRAQTYSIYQSGMRSMSLKVEKSRETGETAAVILGLSTLAALAIGILVSFLIYRSISKPLAHLTEGTRAIAEGKFFYRLDTSRNDEFSQLARDFNTMTLRLNELDKLKKDFVSHVSHELKSPLATIQEIVQALLEEIPGPLTEKQRRLLELNFQSVRRLQSMIGNLLDLSRIEAGVMEYEMKSRDLAQLARAAAAELEMQAREKQIRIQTALPGEPLTLECDGDRILQVLVNIIGNAVKFSPPEGTVEVKAEAVCDLPEGIPQHWRPLIAGTAGGERYRCVTVSDSGPGIPDEEKEKVFERFHQVRKGKKTPGQGAGLGLAICRTIVKAHGGAVWVEDNPGGGSRFCVLLPPRHGGGSAAPGASAPI